MTDRPLDQLDSEQAAAVTADGGPVVLIAGAGTGKTRTLSHRLAKRVADGAIDPAATLAVSFTTAAAAELRDRLGGLGASGVQCRTFHAAALRQAQYFWPLVYGAELPRVIDQPDDLLRQACARTGLGEAPAVRRRLAAEVSWTKQTNVLPEDYARLAAASGRTVPRLTPDEIGDAIAAYEDAKQAAGVIDLDDLPLCAVALLSGDRHVATQVRATYRHFLVDEFQDISPVQARLLDLWLGERDDVCVVGDPAQTIHSYAGARSVYLTGFAQRHAGASELALTSNYRSAPEILRWANALNPSGQALRPTVPAGGVVDLVAAATPLDEAERLADWALRRHRAGLDWPELALLFRTRAQAESIRQILADHAIPFAYQASSDVAPGPGVHLGTLHGAKGREWAAVAIGGLHDGSLPHPLATTPDQISEERRLLYVGVTRAKTELRLSWPVNVDGRPVARSRFLDQAQRRLAEADGGGH